MSAKPTEGGAVPPTSKKKARNKERPTLPPSALPGISPTGGEIGSGSERIAKRLARAGVASRREAEALIAAGRVKLNGKVLDSPAVNVGPADRIEIDGEPIPAIERTRLFLFHKPAGVVTTNRDPEGRRTVFDVLPEGLPRLITVGRLDINTEGLLLLTNDGGLARVLELPQTGWLRRYRVRVHGEVDEKALEGLKQGIAVDGVFYGAIEAALDRRQGSNAWITVGLREGKNREVKNVMAALGLEVTRLIRVSYGPFQLGDLPEGQVQELRGRTLRDQLGPRLIAESGANFDAPIIKPFSSRTAQADATPSRGKAEERREPREDAGGPGRGRKPDRTTRRDAALARLSTRAPDKSRHKPERPETGRRSRASNVWMAPGARPKADGTGGEKVVKIPRKPGDRKARHEAAAAHVRPGRAEREAAKAGDMPAREQRPGRKREDVGGTQDRKSWKGSASKSPAPNKRREGAKPPRPRAPAGPRRGPTKPRGRK